MSANKAKGTAWESAVRDYLNRHLGQYGIEVRRLPQEGYRDTGDLDGLPYFAVQCKHWREVMSAIREGIDGVQVQKQYAGKPFGVAIVKRPRKRADQAYAVMTLEDFTRFLALLLDALRSRCEEDHTV